MRFIKEIRTAIDIPLLLFVGIILISGFQSIYIPENAPIIQNKIINYPWIKSIFKIVLLFGSIFIYYACIYLLNSKEKIKEYFNKHCQFIVLFSICSFIILLIFISFGYTINREYNPIINVSDDLPRIRGTEQEPLFFGFYLLTVLPVIYSFLFVSSHNKNQVMFCDNRILLIYGGIITLTLFATGARSVILGFFFSLLVLLYIYKEERSWIQYCKDIWKKLIDLIKIFFNSKKIKAMSLLCLILIASVFLIFKDNLQPIIKEDIKRGIIIPIIGTFDRSYGKYWSTRTRLVTYDYAKEAFKQHPWLGIGYENFNFYSGNKMYVGLVDFNMNWPEANNYPLKVLAELGIIGFLFFLFLVLCFFYHLWNAQKKTKDPFLKAFIRGYIAAFVGIGIILFFSSNITKPYLWVAMGFALAAVKIVNNEQNEENEKNRSETELKMVQSS